MLRARLGILLLRVVRVNMFIQWFITDIFIPIMIMELMDLGLFLIGVINIGYLLRRVLQVNIFMLLQIMQDICIQTIIMAKISLGLYLMLIVKHGGLLVPVIQVSMSSLVLILEVFI